MNQAFATLDGLKRAAKAVAKGTAIRHTEALEKVARDAGFVSYKHASNVLSSTSPSETFLAEISVSWANRQQRERGVERLQISLPEPITSFIKPKHLSGDYLGGFEIGPDGSLFGDFYGNDTPRDRPHARREACKAARALQFIHATGLQPTASYKCYPKGKSDNGPSFSRHDRRWYHSETKSYVLTIEPYADLLSHSKPDCDAWCERHGFEMIHIQRGSLYGLGTNFYFLVRSDIKNDWRGVLSRFEQSYPEIDEQDVNLVWI